MATHTDQARGSGHLQQETGWGPGRTASLSVLLPWGLGNGALPPLCPHASPSVALLPMPKREREGGPGRKSVLPNNSPLSHTYTHTHSRAHTSHLLPFHSWHNSLNQIGKRRRHPPPFLSMPEPVPGSLGSASTHLPHTRVPWSLLQCSDKGQDYQPQ